MRLTLCAFVTFQEHITFLRTAIRASFGKNKGTSLSWAPNMPKLFLWPGLCPDPAGGAYSTPPD